MQIGLVACSEFEIVWKSRQFPGHTYYFGRKKKNEIKNENYYTCKACGKEKAKRKRLDPVPSITLSNENYIIGDPEAGHFCIDADGLPLAVPNVRRPRDVRCIVNNVINEMKLGTTKGTRASPGTTLPDSPVHGGSRCKTGDARVATDISSASFSLDYIAHEPLCRVLHG